MQVLDGGFCSACFNHITDQKVVDMGADWEGGMQDGLSIDDLRICAPCVRSAAEALDLDGKESALQKALHDAEEARRKSEEWQAYARKLENVRTLRPVEDLPEVKKTGRKKAAA